MRAAARLAAMVPPLLQSVVVAGQKSFNNQDVNGLKSKRLKVEVETHFHSFTSTRGPTCCKKTENDLTNRENLWTPSLSPFRTEKVLWMLTS